MIRSILALLLLLMGQLTLAQPSSELAYSADHWRYYQIQAFQANSARQRLSLNHLGMEVEQSNGGYLVSAVLEGYPAHLAGINRGDELISVGDQDFHPVFSFNDSEAAPNAFTAKEQQFTLQLKRNDNTLDVEVTPVFENLYDSYRTATLNSIQQFAYGNKVIGYVRIWALSRSSNDLIALRGILQELARTDGLIVDLRDSSGYLDPAHLDLFFPNRNNYPEITAASGWLESFDVMSPELAINSYRKPMALLINERTTGGAELLAYQLAKLGRVDVIGSKTPGLIGEFRVSDNSGEFQYQPALETLIDGNIFETEGVTPHLEVPYPTEQSTRTDPQYQLALNYLTGTI